MRALLRASAWTLFLVPAGLGKATPVMAEASDGVAVLQRPGLPLPANLPGRYGLIGVRVEAAGDTAVQVISTVAKGPAARAGLRRGDLVLGADDYTISARGDLSRYVQSREPGTEVSLLIERSHKRDRLPQRLAVQCTVTDVKRLYGLMNERGGTVPALDLPRHQLWLGRRDSLESTATSLIGRTNLTATLRDLQGALAFESERYGADLRLADAQFALTQPLKVAAMADGLSRDVAGFRELDDYLRFASLHLDLAPAGTPTAAGADSGEQAIAPADEELPPQLAKTLFTPFWRASRRVDAAFGSLRGSERRRLLRRVPDLLSEFAETGALDQGDSTDTAKHAGTLRLAKRVDIGEFLAAARLLAPLTQPKVLKQIRNEARKLSGNDVADLPATFGGEFLYARRTPQGWMLIGGDGDNFYGEDAALIVDLGGDDVYLNNCGSPVFAAARGKSTHEQLSPVGLLIDFGGDDHYAGSGWGRVGAAIGGVGFLIDLKGDDTYQGTGLTQGSAFCGVGVLWDKEGDDRFGAQQTGQAAAFFGAGLLLERAGSDRYVAAQRAQAFGGAGGIGILHDREGADQYLADRVVPSSYGSEGVFDGWSQGVGCGFRGSGAGGIGLLVDGAGDDLYQAGNFSQGVGYFFGLGMLADVDGDDRYRSSRYSQGAGAHQAAGCLLDLHGDDDYVASQAANQGAAWDAAVGVLEDRAGNDRYEAGGLAQGAASMNGVAALFDWAGKDRYMAESGQGMGDRADYWQGRNALNIGLFLDTGGQADEYSVTARGDDGQVVSPGIGLFMDR